MGLIRRLGNSARLAVAARRERRFPFRPLAEVEHLQRRRLHRIVRHAWETVPFWRADFQERGMGPGDVRTLADLAALPILDSRDVRLRLAEFRSSRWPDGTTLVQYSSGSAEGTRQEIHWDPRSQLMKLAWAERDRAVVTRLAGREWGHRQLWLLPEASASVPVRAWWDTQVFMPRRLVERDIFCLERTAELSFEEVAGRLGATRPTVVYSYGSFAERFFRWIEASGETPYLPRVWVYGGDGMDPGWRARAERHGCYVLSTYQSVETGRLGWECERREGFHLNVDLCAVRLVDEEGRDVPAGEVGHVVVSSLVNRATVLFNMPLGDRAALAHAPCPCGRSLPLLARLEGRAWETIRLGDGRTIASTGLRTAMKDELAFALQVQIVHPGPGRLVWRVVALPGADVEPASRRLIDGCRRVVGSETAVEVEVVDEIPLEPSGKARLVARAAAAGV